MGNKCVLSSDGTRSKSTAAFDLYTQVLSAGGFVLSDESLENNQTICDA